METYSSSSSVATCCAVVMAASDSRDSCGCRAGATGRGNRSTGVRLQRGSGGLDADSFQQRRGDPFVRQQRDSRWAGLMRGCRRLSPPVGPMSGQPATWLWVKDSTPASVRVE